MASAVALTAVTCPEGKVSSPLAVRWTSGFERSRWQTLLIRVALRGPEYASCSVLVCSCSGSSLAGVQLLAHEDGGQNCDPAERGHRVMQGLRNPALRDYHPTRLSDRRTTESGMVQLAEQMPA